MGKKLDKLKRARQKARAKVRGLSVSEMAEVDAIRRKTKHDENLAYQKWKAKQGIKEKYSRKRERSRTGPGLWGRIQAHGEKVKRGHSILLGTGEPRRDARSLIYGDRKKKRDRR